MATRTLPSCGLVLCALIALTAASTAQVGGDLPEALKIMAPDAEPHGYLGHARMSLSALVAATPAIGSELGALYVFDRESGALRFKLAPADADLNDSFGMAVALHGRGAVVGAQEKDLHGAAYVFDVREGEELYVLLPPDAQDAVSFGASVAINDEEVVVGAPGDELFPPNAGTVYVFDRRTGALRWRLAPPDLTSGFPYDAYFGMAVAADRGRVLAGAPGDAQLGSAYLFDAASGSQLHKWLPPAGNGPNGFGWSVDLHGELAAIGDNEADGYRGAAHVFDAVSGRRLFTVQAPDGEPGDGFGASVAVDERYLAVGAPWDKDASFTGSVYLFRVDNAQLVAKLHGFRAHDTERFGSSVDLDSGSLAIADTQDSEAAVYAGAAYVVPLAPGR